MSFHNTNTPLPFKFTFDGEQWVVVQSPGREMDEIAQCQLCQYSRVRPEDEGRTWCSDMATRAARAANDWGMTCGPHPVVYIRDTEEGWAEHARNVLAGGV